MVLGGRPHLNSSSEGEGLRSALFLPPLLLLAACQPQSETYLFPLPDRPVAPIVSPRYSNEDARDSAGEAERVMALAGIRPGMRVADIGAGEGYYTVRLSPLVGPEGRVLAQDIVPETRDALAQRVQREALDNVAVKLGRPEDPLLPDGSFDRVLLIHMYHEIERPAEFLWHLRADLKPGTGRVVVVDADRPTSAHGTPLPLLLCEFGALGYRLEHFDRLDRTSYFAQFAPGAPRPAPGEIRTCPAVGGAAAT